MFAFRKGFSKTNRKTVWCYKVFSPQNVMNDVIHTNLKEIIKKYNLNYKSKCGKTYNIGKCSLPDF